MDRPIRYLVSLVDSVPESSKKKSSFTSIVQIVLTREEGNNYLLHSAISSHASMSVFSNALTLKFMEIPCIQHTPGPSLDMFHELLSDEPEILRKYDYLVMTSPYSAQVVGEALRKSGVGALVKNEYPNIAAVGKATQIALLQQGLMVDFVPTKANSETLSKELPFIDSPQRIHRVLYPTSTQAADTIEENLGKRKDVSFQVTRLDVYETVAPEDFTPCQLQQILFSEKNLACFGSPSSVNAWVSNVDTALKTSQLSEEDCKYVKGWNGNSLAVCIGSTTAEACLESERWVSGDIYYPKENPGMEGWANSCFEALGDLV